MRLDVAVQDAGRVDVAQRREQLLGERLGSGASARRAGDSPRSPPVDVLHDQVGALAGAEVVDRDEVRMLKSRRDLRLAAEALQVDAVAGERVGEDLHRDRALEALVEPASQTIAMPPWPMRARRR